MNHKIQMEVGPLMKVLNDNKKPIVVLQGGTGSGKTYSILQFIIIGCLTKWDNWTIDINRRTFPSMKISVMYDFFNIIKNFYKIFDLIFIR